MTSTGPNDNDEDSATIERIEAAIAAIPGARPASAMLIMWGAGFQAIKEQRQEEVARLNAAEAAASALLLAVQSLDLWPPHLKRGADFGAFSSAKIEDLTKDLRAFVDDVSVIRSNLGMHGKPNRRRNEHAQNVATAAAQEFEYVTGRKPTITVDPITGAARGDFINFIKELFNILRIKASPEHYARLALKELRHP